MLESVRALVAIEEAISSIHRFGEEFDECWGCRFEAGVVFSGLKHLDIGLYRFGDLKENNSPTPFRTLDYQILECGSSQ